MVKIKKKKVANVELLSKLVEESELPIYRIEKEMGMARSVLLRGLQPETKRPLAPRWEIPLAKYLKKKIAEKIDVEMQTQEIKLEMGFSVPEPESDLKENLKEEKRNWVGSLHG